MLEIGAIVWGVHDISRAVKFWSAALDYQLKYPDGNPFCVVQRPF